ncbi:hypothetical protein STXM2123_5435 [Streptomyces sp. F-3]|jgi:hypothetical protein|uniref:Secreted protein n=1 Tax=Streptomyces thermogriseus TaxID=75292 RepID=A0ABN1T3X1_9ACTN|nr:MULTISPECIES: hypothetical protein [Streptomyces]MDN5383968.1 hypothetical protein [Streptomyces sp. LB8]GAT84734.1 hypothetical protein STXM2123_5435 [Streptomyces sp. F-3]
MFRRTFWFTTGLAAGVWATTKVNRKLKQLTPENLAVIAANKALEAGHRFKDRAVCFALDVRDHMAQREAELGEALGIAAPVDHGLPSSKRPVALEPGVPPSRRYAAIENHTSPTYVDGSPYPTYSYNRNEDH